MPFAWDDYTARHTVEVSAAVQAPGGKSTGDLLVSSKRSICSFDLDTFKVRLTGLDVTWCLTGYTCAATETWHGCIEQHES
jgi:hypothetical protein